MAQGHRRGAKGGPRRLAARGRAGGEGHARRAPTPARIPEPAPAELPSRPFRLGAIPGATPGKWIDTWKERMPRTPLELVPVAVADQRAALDDDLDAAIVRLPIDRAGLGVIPLYDEVAVVVCAADSALTAADELDPSDLTGEVVITPQDDVMGPLALPDTVGGAFDPPQTTADAIAIVASGVGFVVVPMSLARLHHRRDVAYRPLRGAPASSVALAWREDRDSPALQSFIGIVRGRTLRSSRG